MPFVKNLKQQTLFQQELLIAQAENQDQSQQDPLIDYGAEHLIDAGVVLLAVTTVLVIGMISKHTGRAIFFALALSTFLIIILWNI